MIQKVEKEGRKGFSVVTPYERGREKGRVYVPPIMREKGSEDLEALNREPDEN